MNRCLSDQVLLQCYSGDGAADDLAHLRNCLACAGRYQQLKADMALITQALDAPPPLRRRARAGAFARWRAAISIAAVAAAFVFGWSLRGPLLPQFSAAHSQVALHQPPPNAPLQLSAIEPTAINTGGATPAIYAAFVQDAFGNPCSEANDPLDPGCL